MQTRSFHRISHRISFAPKQDIGGSTYILLLTAILTLAVYAIPFLHPIAYPFLLISTIVHEMGHGVAALLVGAQFEWFKMWPDGSGVAYITGSAGRIQQAFIAAGGLLGPALVSALFFAISNRTKLARFGLLSFALLLILAEVFVVRNLFGILFVGALSLLCLYFACQTSFTKMPQFFVLFLAIQLCLSVFSRMDYLFTPYAQTQSGIMPSDVAAIESALFLPYWFWGGLVAAVSLFILVLGFRQFMRRL